MSKQSPFNPTAIRCQCFPNGEVGMVVTNMSGDDTYFQIYVSDGTSTFLQYTMPWTTTAKAIEDFNAWIDCKNSGAPMQYRHSYAAPEVN